MARRRSSMKMKQLIKIAEAIHDKKLPSDMYDLDSMYHYSINQDEILSIADMDVVHFVRAFNHQARKLNKQYDDKELVKQNNDLIEANKTLGRLHDMWKEKAMNMVEKETHEAVKKALAEVNKQPTVKAEAYDLAWKEAEKWEARANYWKSEYDKATYKKGCNYVFSEIPNDEEGNAFVRNMKQYLNKESYKIRVKGQYLKDEVKEADGWRPYNYGQPINKSKCLRVYVDKNKGE